MLPARVQLTLPATIIQQVWRVTLALIAVGSLTAILWIARHFLASTNLLLCYVPLVLLVALRLGRAAAVLAAVAAFLGYNFFFVTPRYTLTVERPQDLIELLVFLSISILVGTLAARQRALTVTATRQAQRMTLLYDLSRALSAATDIDRVLTTMITTVQRVVNAAAVEIEIAAVADHPTHTKRIGTPDNGPIFVQPIGTESARLGHVRIWGMPTSDSDPEVHVLVTAIANHAALAIERRRTLAAALQSEALREADRLKSALLSSVSHDLRTPLAVIKGAASNLLDTSITWDAAMQHTFAATIVSEADRLNRLMRNMFEMSRLETGTVRRQHTLVEIGDVIGPTVARLRSLFADHQIIVQIAPDLPAVPMDPVQIELVLSNLLENAAKFAPVDTDVVVCAERTTEGVLVSVADCGPGVPPANRVQIFEKFFRAAAPEQGPGGTGLGLAICQGIIEAHVGRIWVDEHVGGGAVFCFVLPFHQPDVVRKHTQALAEVV